MARVQTSGRRAIQNCDYSILADATASMIDLGTSGPIAGALTQFTISAWCKFTANKLQAIVGDVNASAMHFALEILGGSSRGKPQLRVATDGTSGTAVSTTARIELNDWHMITGVYDGANAIIYIDGVAVGSAVATGTCAASGSAMHLFNGQNNARFCGGYGHTFQFSTVAFTPAQVAQLYASNSDPTLRALLTNEWLRTGGGSGTNIPDEIGSNTGTASSVTWSTDTAYKSRTQTSGRRLGGNLINNADFENAPSFTAAGTTPSRWIDGTVGGSTTNDASKWAFNSETGTATVQFDSSTAHSGTYSMKLSLGATGSVVSVKPIVSTSAATLARYGCPALPSTSYTLKYWMKTNYTSGDSNDGARIQILEYSPTGSNVAFSDGTKIKTTADWTQYTVTFTTNSSTVYLIPNLIITGNTGTATLIMDGWFDDIELIIGTNGGRTQIT